MCDIYSVSSYDRFVECLYRLNYSKESNTLCSIHFSVSSRCIYSWVDKFNSLDFLCSSNSYLRAIPFYNKFHELCVRPLVEFF